MPQLELPSALLVLWPPSTLILNRWLLLAAAGCVDAARAAFAAVVTALKAPGAKDAVAAKLNLCTPLPPYLAQGDATLFQEELMMVFMYSFADL